MRIDILTCLPSLLASFLSYSIIKRAIDSNTLDLNIHDLHDFSLDRHKKTDDYAYSGIPGLVMKIEPIDRCISFLQEKNKYDEIIYMCPDGKILDQNICNELSKKKILLFYVDIIKE